MTTSITSMVNIQNLLEQAVVMMERGEMPWLVDVGGRRFSLIHAIKARFEGMEMALRKAVEALEEVIKYDSTVDYDGECVAAAIKALQEINSLLQSKP